MKQTRMYVLATLLFAGMAMYAQSVQEEPVTPAIDSTAVVAQDTIAVSADSVAVAQDTIAVTAETVAVAQDTVAVAQESVAVAAVAAEIDELERLKQERAELEQQLRAERQKESTRTTEQETIKQETIKPAKPQKEHSVADDTPKEPLLQRFFHRNGRKSVSILSVGYSTYFMVGQPAGVPSTRDAFQRHILDMEILEFRIGIFGMQLLNFEMGINTPSATLTMFERGGSTPDIRIEATTKTMWFAYKPAVKFYIPCTKWMAVELFGGAEVDLTKLWGKAYKDYYKDTPEAPENNFFVNAYGGLGVMLLGVPQLPVEVKAEYRHPVKGNTALVPQGIYLTFQLHLAAPLQRNK